MIFLLFFFNQEDYLTTAGDSDHSDNTLTFLFWYWNGTFAVLKDEAVQPDLNNSRKADWWNVRKLIKHGL